MTSRKSFALSSVSVLVLALGCSAPKPEPVVAPSSHEAVFAGAYAAELDDVGRDFAMDQDAARKILGSLSDLPSRLKKPDGPWVAQIVDKADTAGRSEAYAERMKKTQAAGSFFEEDRDVIANKVAGNAQYVVKEKKCDVDVTGTISGTLKDTFEKQLQKRLRERNEAQTIVDRYRTTMPKEDAPVLEDAADDIAYASYVVHIALIEEKVRVRKLLEEASDVPKTADAYVKTEQDFQAEQGRTDADKKASQARIDAMNGSKGQVEAAAQKAKALSDQMDKQIADLDKAYNDAITALKAKVKAK